MVAVYGENAPSYFKVKFWSKQFKWGRYLMQNNQTCDRPLKVRTEKTVGTQWKIWSSRIDE